MPEEPAEKCDRGVEVAVAAMTCYMDVIRNGAKGEQEAKLMEVWMKVSTGRCTVCACVCGV